MKKNKKIGKLDQFYYNEATDRLHIVANQINDILIEHPVFVKHKSLKRRVKKAERLILKAYQLAGNLEYKLFPDQFNKSGKQ